MPNNPNVNVIFHGLFLFVEQKDHIDVLITNMGHDHVYRAGLFLAEESLMPYPVSLPYFLDGVTGTDDRDDVHFDKNLNIVFRGDFNHKVTEKEAFARIVVPVPIQIVSLRRTVDPLVADYDPRNIVNGKRPCGVQVLRYFAPDLNKVKLVSHGAELKPAAGAEFLNIHIISEPDSQMGYPGSEHSGSEHVLNGFLRTLHLLRDVDAPIFIKNITTLEPITNVNLPGNQGYAAIETDGVRERAENLVLAGQAWRLNQPFTYAPIGGMADAPPQDCVSMASDHSD